MEVGSSNTKWTSYQPRVYSVTQDGLDIYYDRMYNKEVPTNSDILKLNVDELYAKYANGCTD